MSFNIYLITKRGKNRWVNVNTPPETFTETFVEPPDMLFGGLEWQIHYDRIHGTDCYLERW